MQRNFRGTFWTCGLCPRMELRGPRHEHRRLSPVIEIFRPTISFRVLLATTLQCSRRTCRPIHSSTTTIHPMVHTKNVCSVLKYCPRTMRLALSRPVVANVSISLVETKRPTRSPVARIARPLRRKRWRKEFYKFKKTLRWGQLGQTLCWVKNCVTGMAFHKTMPWPWNTLNEPWSWGTAPP